MVASIATGGYQGVYMDRLLFALAVFHAYGHQWPCQVVYHPRKRKGFGLSDGEGCERFWSSIKGLISPLRVSGFHQRLMVLDERVIFLGHRSFLASGDFFERRLEAIRKQRAKATAALNASGVAIDVLRVEWAAQVLAQTKPRPTRSRNAGRNAVQAVLALRQSAESYEQDIATFEEELASLTTDLASDKIADTVANIAKSRQRLAIIRRSIQAKTALLGLDDQHDLRRLIKSKFLQLRMNAWATKLRLRQKLCDRRYERERLEHSYRNTANERNLSQSTMAAIKNREPGIVALAKSYNADCAQMAHIIRLNQAPRGAVAPRPIPRDKVFGLDVDDEIWQDAGLVDDDEAEEAAAGNVPPVVPRWLGDEKVRIGIPALLTLDRCEEETRRLGLEVCALREWMCTEWQAIEVAKVRAGDDEELVCLLNRKLLELEDLDEAWEERTSYIPPAYPLPPFDTTELRRIVDKVVNSVREELGGEEAPVVYEDDFDMADDIDDDDRDGGEAINHGHHGDDDDDDDDNNNNNNHDDDDEDYYNDDDDDDEVRLEDIEEAELAEEFENRFYIDALHTHDDL